MSSLLLLPFLICLLFSSRVCDARRLFMEFDGVVNVVTKPIKGFDLPNKRIENFVKVEDSSMVQLMTEKPEERSMVLEKKMTGSGKRRVVEVVKKTNVGMLSGSESNNPSSHNFKRQPSKFEGSQKLDQFAVESHVHEGAGEFTEPHVSDIHSSHGLSQPHRKPLINNKAP